MVIYLKKCLWSGLFLGWNYPYYLLRASPSPLRILLEDCSPNHRNPSQSHKNLQGVTQKHIKYTVICTCSNTPLKNIHSFLFFIHFFFFYSLKFSVVANLVEDRHHSGQWGHQWRYLSVVHPQLPPQKSPITQNEKLILTHEVTCLISK